MVVETMPAAVSLVAIDEVKAFLRIDGSDEDALLAGLVRTATGLAEAFTLQRLLIRDFSEMLNASARWQRLHTAPVVAITGIDGAQGPLPGGAYETDIDLAGNGWVRNTDLAPVGAEVARALDLVPSPDGWERLVDRRPPVRMTVRYRAGLAADWNGVPEALRQGIVRLVVHFYTHRDAADAGGPPAAVAALWRPWRRMRLH